MSTCIHVYMYTCTHIYMCACVHSVVYVVCRSHDSIFSVCFQMKRDVQKVSNRLNVQFNLLRVPGFVLP